MKRFRVLRFNKTVSGESFQERRFKDKRPNIALVSCFLAIHNDAESCLCRQLPLQDVDSQFLFDAFIETVLLKRFH